MQRCATFKERERERGEEVAFRHAGCDCKTLLSPVELPDCASGIAKQKKRMRQRELAYYRSELAASNNNNIADDNSRSAEILNR